MHSTLVILLSAAVLLRGISCHLFPLAVFEKLTGMELSNQYKRHANTYAIVQCVNDKVDAAFRGNTSRFASYCKSILTRDEDLDFSNTLRLQSQITVIYNIFCIRDCGDVILEAYNDCRVFDAELPGSEELSVGLCGTNLNGDICYQLYGRGIDLVSTELSCYRNYTSLGVCSCQFDLSDAVDEQGCCINLYHNFFSGLNRYNPDELYDKCNVTRPSSCNNSPLTKSGSLSQVFFLSVVTITAALICYTVLV